MKRLIALLLAAAAMFSFAACGTSSDPKKKDAAVSAELELPDTDGVFTPFFAVLS